MLYLSIECFDKKMESKRSVVRAYLGISFSAKQMVYAGLDPSRASCPRPGLDFDFDFDGVSLSTSSSTPTKALFVAFLLNINYAT
jgi:hypothetical protein